MQDFSTINGSIVSNLSEVHVFKGNSYSIPRDPITLSEDDWGVKSPPKRRLCRFHETILSFGEPGSPKGMEFLILWIGVPDSTNLEWLSRWFVSFCILAVWDSLPYRDNMKDFPNQFSVKSWSTRYGDTLLLWLQIFLLNNTSLLFAWWLPKVSSQHPNWFPAMAEGTERFNQFLKWGPN